MTLLQKLSVHKKELLLLMVLLIIAGVAHGYNMFHFPYYENDEGTYMSQAWSLLTSGKLAPYTYWYDHAPAGWILIALWVKLTGGFFTFGTAVNSGRVLMLLLHLGTAALLFYVAKKLSGSLIPGTIAVLLFSLTPLGIYFQRRVLLDNIMIFWVFVSLALLLIDKPKLRHVILSAITFGIAVLTKENAIFFIPAFLLLVYQRSHKHHRNFAIVKWLSISGLVISLYFIYALLKGEFFPVGFLGNTSPHVSLLSTLQAQLGRGGSYPFWDARSDFYRNLTEWSKRDLLLMVAGIIATILSILLSIKAKSLRFSTILTAFFWIFLLRGKLVIDFYVVPLIPLLALNIGMVWDFIARKVSFNKKLLYYTLSGGGMIIMCAYFLMHPIGQYTKDETTPQVKTIAWIKKNLPSDSNIVIDDSFYVDLHEKKSATDKVFPNADWAWKVEDDPHILDDKYHDDWKKIEYITLSHEILKQIKDSNFPMLKHALDNATVVAEWKDNSTSYIDIPHYISTNGDWMAIYKVDDSYEIALNSSWRFYKKNFIQSYGQVVDPSNGNTTSEGQSYALLRAVWLNDRNTFDGVFSWTKDHLQYRSQDKLFSWLWTKEGNTYHIGDPASASDADEDIALALLFANKRWGNPAYLQKAKQIIHDIWDKEVVKIDGHYYLTSGSGAEREEGYLLNPSYLSPATYKIFATVDDKHPWVKLADDSYYILNKLGTQKNNKIYLPPNGVLIEKNTGSILSPAKYNSDENASDYGFDAFRTMWRVALDATWFNNIEAIQYLSKVSPFYELEWLKNKKIDAIYSLDGSNRVDYDSLSTDVGALAALSVTDSPLAKNAYTTLLKNKFNFDNGYWGDKNNYYDQNWAWFGTALFNNGLPNLWKNKNS